MELLSGFGEKGFEFRQRSRILLGRKPYAPLGASPFEKQALLRHFVNLDQCHA